MQQIFKEKLEAKEQKRRMEELEEYKEKQTEILQERIITKAKKRLEEEKEKIERENKKPEIKSGGGLNFRSNFGKFANTKKTHPSVVKAEDNLFQRDKAPAVPSADKGFQHKIEPKPQTQSAYHQTSQNKKSQTVTKKPKK